MSGSATLRVIDLHKSFRLHNRDGLVLPVLDGLSMEVQPGECVVLSGPSGAGKSTLLRCVYCNYLCDSGSILVRHDGQETDVAHANHRTILDLRRRAIGYVSQFLRAVPRVPTREVVAEPLLRLGWATDQAYRRAEELLAELGIPARLWSLPPATFSGGEQQRVNLARGFAYDYSILLLDEPTSALDSENRRRVAALIERARARGAAVIGVFHDSDLAQEVGSRMVAVTPVVRAAA